MAETIIEAIARKFDSLQTRVDANADPILARLLSEAVKAVPTSGMLPRAVFTHLRTLVEHVVGDVYRREFPEQEPPNLAGMINALYRHEGILGRPIAENLHYVRASGNLVTHPPIGDLPEVLPRDRA
jgi:hypothetical protein